LKLASDAENTIKRREKLQREYFGDVYGAQPEDTSLYDIIIDTSSENIPVASITIGRFVRQSLALQTA
jgi:cytidylate kinase